jgi:hypothetical protein
MLEERLRLRMLRGEPGTLPCNLAKRGVSWGLSAKEFNLAVGAGCSAEAFVGGQEDRLECFGQCDVGGVIGREVFVKLPDPTHEWLMVGAIERQDCEIAERLAGPLLSKPPGPRGTPPYRRHLEIDEFGCEKALAHEPPAGPLAVRAVIAQC